jgi:hypothetical protein
MQVTLKYERRPGDKIRALANLYDQYALDMNETAQTYGINRLAVALTMFEWLLKDICEAEGCRSPERDELVRQAYIAYWRHA